MPVFMNTNIEENTKDEVIELPFCDEVFNRRCSAVTRDIFIQPLKNKKQTQEMHCAL